MDHTNVTPEVTPPATIAGSSPRHRWLWRWGFALVVLAMIAAAFYWQQQVQQQWQVKQHQFHSLLRHEQLKNQQMTQAVQQLQTQNAQQQAALNRLQQQIATVQSQTNGATKPWKMAEIAYLVRLADLQLQVQRSIPSAINLLKQAEAQTRALADPGLTAFQQKLLKDISTLQNLSSPDILNITTQLNTLQQQVPSLSLLVAPKPNTSPVLQTPHQAHKRWWQRAWDNIKASLQALVIVRHEDQPLPPLMPPEQQVYLQQNLQLLLVQARWAAMNGQSALYEQSLRESAHWVQKFYVQNSASTQNFLKQLAFLQAQNIAPVLPDLTPTLALLPSE